MEAHIVCARLSAEGIPATVAFADHAIIDWPAALALGGTAVQVPDEHLVQARRIVAEYRVEELEAELPEEPVALGGGALLGVRIQRDPPRGAVATATAGGIAWCLRGYVPDAGERDGLQRVQDALEGIRCGRRTTRFPGAMIRKSGLAGPGRRFRPHR